MFKPGDQIVYIPSHARGDKSHPDCEYGFVEKVKGNTVYCRYWNKSGDLRTVANAEGTNIQNLKKHKSVPQAKVVSYLSTAREF